MSITFPQLKTIKKFGLLSSLYVSQFLPLGFFDQALPVFMREQGFSLESIGFVYLLGLPWMIKFLWSPWIDRYSLSRRGHYRFWILLAQSLSACVVAGLAFVDIRQNFGIGLIGFALVCFLAATQDIATDALAVGSLHPKQRGFGNGIQNASNYLGAILGGGVLLILINQLGWTKSLLVLSILLALPLFPVFFYKEHAKLKADDTTTGFRPFFHFFRRSGNRTWLLVVSLLSLSPSMASGMFKPLLVDAGLSLQDIGLLSGIVGYSSGMVGALLGGVLLHRLGHMRALIIFSTIQAISLIGFLIPAIGIVNLPVLYAVSSTFNFASGMSATALFTIMMDRSDLSTAGSDYTLQSAMRTTVALLASALGGFIASALGFLPFFAGCVIISLICVAASARLLNPKFL
ncbi:arabinose efflux permease family protein [Leptolyngbya sp. Heron Island J]|uniref:MFS transporter n=1 Tax=Leptolyngbya sp. Heron Island J TaxID=1385935 RepID=UPI0003B9AC2E|nr:MFS transporter [Leptolyngbya sp. Heron Island J]ESA35638.1 arabinose efflux permease family protein [Leptolyngbya sp. Heron Island J]